MTTPAASAEFLTIDQARAIKPGDMVRVVSGARAGLNEIVRSVSESENVFSPLCGWYGGRAVWYRTVDGGRVYHFQLDAAAPVTERAWLSREELAAL
jgi:hypothetical protein